MDARRQRLHDQTRRWRERHEARRVDPAERPDADPERQARAAAAFPVREMSPLQYAERYGGEMIGFIYDEYRYDDPQLDVWLVELGGILRERRETDG